MKRSLLSGFKLSFEYDVTWKEAKSPLKRVERLYKKLLKKGEKL